MEKIDQIFLIILYVIFLCFILFNICLKIKKDKQIKIKTFFEVYYLIIYGLTPVISIIFINYNNTVNSFFYTRNVKYYYSLFFVTVIFYFIYHFFDRMQFSVGDMKNKCKEFKQIDTSSDRFFFVTILLSFIGLFSLILWTRAFGMPWDIIKYANVIRSGRSPIYNKFTFVKPFCSFLTIAFYNNLIIAKKTRFKLLNFIDLVLNFIFSIIFLLANDSRMFILIFFLCIVLLYKNKNINFNLKTVCTYVIIAIFTLSILGGLDNFTYYLRNNKFSESESNSKFYEVIEEEFTYTYRNGINVLYFYDNYKLPSIHIFKDLKNIIFSWVPDRFKPDLEGLSELNTSYYIGTTGAMPTDLITASIYKFHLFGIFIMPLFMNFLLNSIENFFKKYNSEYMYMIYNLIGCSICLRFVGYYDLADNLFSAFYIIVSTFIVCFFCTSKNSINNI